jgi:2-C-methyl-D-erythritol 4-phosphate cytidylyltransferase
MNFKEYALVVAGGKGTRVNSKIPKQFIELNGLPVLMHSLLAFFRYSPQIAVILVLPEDDMDTWKALCLKHKFAHALTLQGGGQTRFQSVKNGLEIIAGDGLVAIHDGARPLVTEAIIAASFRLAAVRHSAIASVPLKESIRMTDNKSSKAVDRSQFRLIQTPQTFHVSLIKQAYQMMEDATLTDDASVAERAGHPISLFEGSYENIKITTSEDLIVAHALMKARHAETI